MYGILYITYIWLIFMVYKSRSIYQSHGSYGPFQPHLSLLFPQCLPYFQQTNGCHTEDIICFKKALNQSFSRVWEVQRPTRTPLNIITEQINFKLLLPPKKNTTPWKFHIATENKPSQKRKVIFQPSFFRGYLKLRGGYLFHNPSHPSPPPSKVDLSEHCLS